MARFGYRVWFAARVVAVTALQVGAASATEHVLAQRSDGSWLRPGADHVAFSTELPSATPDKTETEAVRLFFAGFAKAPQAVVRTRRASGGPLDRLDTFSLVPAKCPPGEPAGGCWSSPPLRLTIDALDRAYAPTRERSIEAELGGQLLVETGGSVLGAWPVGAPHSPSFATVGRLSARLRVRILRVNPGGTPAIGGDAGAAVQLARREVLAAGRLWAQCGLDLQGPGALDIQVVDPPPVQLLAVGCDTGLPASGGQVSFRAQGHSVRIATHAEDSPGVVAQRIASSLRRLGFAAQVSPNPRVSFGASGVFDVLIRNRLRPVSLGAELDPRLPLSSDPTLNVCLGEVDLSNGLSHFVEDDAAAGTLEERALIKAFDDGDPATIEVFIVPSFDQTGRIGESFIDDAGASVQNTVIIDRAALRAGPRSNALAHELGHILLDMPGHPDDYGVDQATSLMDSDASDASVFGPRRLSLPDCERMLRESGPDARVPLLRAWPLSPVQTNEHPATSGER